MCTTPIEWLMRNRCLGARQRAARAYAERFLNVWLTNKRTHAVSKRPMSMPSDWFGYRESDRRNFDRCHNRNADGREREQQLNRNGCFAYASHTTTSVGPVDQLGPFIKLNRIRWKRIVSKETKQSREKNKINLMTSSGCMWTPLTQFNWKTPNWLYVYVRLPTDDLCVHCVTDWIDKIIYYAFARIDLRNLFRSSILPNGPLADALDLRVLGLHFASHKIMHELKFQRKRSPNTKAVGIWFFITSSAHLLTHREQNIFTLRTLVGSPLHFLFRALRRHLYCTGRFGPLPQRRSHSCLARHTAYVARSTRCVLSVMLTCAAIKR